MARAPSPPAADAPHLLVVDDDLRIRELLSRYLADHGYRVTTAGNATEARSRLGAFAFDLLVLDVMMPGENGLDLAKSIRDGSEVPILMLTARAEADDRIAGLELGIDDYVPKPFEPRELLLRIGNVLRRAAGGAPEVVVSVEFGEFHFDLASGDLTRGGKRVRITDREREILRVLAATPGEIVPRAALAGRGSAANDRAVDVQINRLRRKIERDPTYPDYLRTVRGVGYFLAATP